jgi:hypothetical protein
VLLALVIPILILMAGLVFFMLKAWQVDFGILKDAWRQLNHKSRMILLVGVLAWFFGLAAGFGIGYAVGGTPQGGIAGALVFAFGLGVIGPLVALRMGPTDPN